MAGGGGTPAGRGGACGADVLALALAGAAGFAAAAGTPVDFAAGAAADGVLAFEEGADAAGAVAAGAVALAADAFAGKGVF